MASADDGITSGSLARVDAMLGFPVAVRTLAEADVGLVSPVNGVVVGDGSEWCKVAAFSTVFGTWASL